MKVSSRNTSVGGVKNHVPPFQPIKGKRMTSTRVSPALCAGRMYSVWVMIGSFNCPNLLRLVVLIPVT